METDKENGNGQRKWKRTKKMETDKENGNGQRKWKRTKKMETDKENGNGQNKINKLTSIRSLFIMLFMASSGVHSLFVKHHVGPNENLVPRQGSLLVLMENGHILTGCRFFKDLSAVAVKTNIYKNLKEKYPQMLILKF